MGTADYEWDREKESEKEMVIVFTLHDRTFNQEFPGFSSTGGHGENIPSHAFILEFIYQEGKINYFTCLTGF